MELQIGNQTIKTVSLLQNQLLHRVLDHRRTQKRARNETFDNEQWTELRHHDPQVQLVG